MMNQRSQMKKYVLYDIIYIKFIIRQNIYGDIVEKWLPMK